MSSLNAFLNPKNDGKEKIKLVVSDRFKDEKGKPAHIVIKSITQYENDLLLKRCRVRNKNSNGVVNEQLDAMKYQDELILYCIEEPNFRSEEFTKAMGVLDPIEGIKKLFTPNEYLKIVAEITKMVSDYNVSEDDVKN